MRRYYLQSGLWMSVLTVLILGGLHVAADLNATDSPSNVLNIEGEFWSDTGTGFALGKMSARSTKIALGPNTNAVVGVDIDASDNKMNDGNTSGSAVAGTDVVVEVFISGLAGPIVGGEVTFDTDKLTVKSATAAAGLFILSTTSSTVSFGAFPPGVALTNDYFGTITLSPVEGVMASTEFTVGVSIILAGAANPTDTDNITTAMMSPLNFNTASSPSASSSDFDGDGMVGTTDFLLFAYHFGSSLGDGTYQAKYDLDGNGVIGLSDVLIFVDNFGQQVPPSGGSATVTIADANLRAVISDSLGKSRNAPITRSEIATLTRIDAPNKGIRSLTGLEHATNLQRLHLGRVRVSGELVNSNDISNLSPLSNLTNLTVLDLTSNSISSISALSNLTSLTALHLGDNSISDISVLSRLTNLERLNLWDNSISDISSLSNLTNLTYLSLSGNRNISDISSLSNLTNLEILYLWGNSISSISALSRLTNLKELYTGSNSISDISSLSGLTNLTILFLDRNSISSISALSRLTNLKELDLYNNSISDISPLVANTGLGSGDTVNLKSNPLSSTSINTHIPALQRRGVTVEFDSGSGSGGSSSSPDLIVESPSVSDNALTAGQSFTLSATVRNQGTGTSVSTTLRYYQSSNSTISTSDTEVGTDSVGGLSASGTSAESISLNAPSSAGTYYYGACVESVSGESDTNNNCSDGVSVTVSSSSGSGGGGGSSQTCTVGLMMNPGDGCDGSGYTLRNDSGVLVVNGNIGGIQMGNTRYDTNSVRLNRMHLTRSNNVWTIVSLP